MKSPLRTTLILALGCLAALVLGAYVALVHQPSKIQQLAQAEKAMHQNQVQVARLVGEQNNAEEAVQVILDGRHGSYKHMPDSLNTVEIARYLEQLTRYAYKNFDIALSGVNRQPDFSTFTYNIVGRAFFSSLYDFVWRIENNENFYRVKNLRIEETDVSEMNSSTGIERRFPMVSFSMDLEAYFGGPPGFYSGRLEAVPQELLPPATPANNPFYPTILRELPPNSEGLVDVERSILVSIAGDRATFQEGSEYRTLRVGDRVYLGRLSEVDPARGRVVARLNRGGISDRVEIDMMTGESPVATDLSLRSRSGIVREWGGYTWVVASRETRHEAESIAAHYDEKGFPVDVLTGVVQGRTVYRVAIGQFSTIEEADAARAMLPPSTPLDAWTSLIQ